MEKSSGRPLEAEGLEGEQGGPGARRSLEWLGAGERWVRRLDREARPEAWVSWTRDGRLVSLHERLGESSGEEPSCCDIFGVVVATVSKMQVKPSS